MVTYLQLWRPAGEGAEDRTPKFVVILKLLCRYKYIFSECVYGGNGEVNLDPRFIPLGCQMLIYIHSRCRITDTELLFALPFNHTEGCVFKPKVKTHRYYYFVFSWFGKCNRCPVNRVDAEFLFLLFYMLTLLHHVSIGSFLNLSGYWRYCLPFRFWPQRCF